MIYIVPTPIGNLDDITVRGIKVLSKAKVVLCEDGKITSKLLMLLNIENKPRYINLVRNNQFNESGIKLALSDIYGKEIMIDKSKQKDIVGNSPLEMTGAAGLVPATHSPKEWQAKPDWVDSMTKMTNSNSAIQNDGNGDTEAASTSNPTTIQNSTDLDSDQNVIAIVTDAGTPGISDPAFEIIKLLQELKLDYTVLPGATACIPAIVSSNLISKDFLFLGFLPLKKGRQTVWSEIKECKYPVVIYESCHRIAKLIEEIQTNLKSSSKISISQEISKKHENNWIGKVKDLNSYSVKDKGEFVIVLKN